MSLYPAGSPNYSSHISPISGCSPSSSPVPSYGVGSPVPSYSVGSPAAIPKEEYYATYSGGRITAELNELLILVF